MSDPRLDPFLAFVTGQTGAPPPPFASWDAVARSIAGLGTDTLAPIFDEVEASVVVDVSDERYERWSEAKRLAANHAAAVAFREAKTLGVASAEQVRTMQAYTGFGGIRNIGILPVGVYPPDIAEASRIWTETAKMGGKAPDHVAAIMERVKDQYFTSLDVCRAMHQMVARVNPTARTYLEPSAGIGRAVRVGPAGIQWILVELDPMLAPMLTLMFPTAKVHPGYFELYAREARRNHGMHVDVVIGNPPYGKRPPEIRDLDLKATKTAEDYFNLAGAACLRPGGTLCYVVPLSTLTRASGVEARTNLLRGAAFRGAALLPSGAFPNVTNGTFAITVWTRRDGAIEEDQFDARERQIAAGGYLELDEALTAMCGGEWKDGFRGKYLHGKPDLTRIGQVWLSPPPGSVPQRRPQAQPQPKGAPQAPTSVEVTEASLSAVAQAAASVMEWIKSIATDPMGAESRREAIRLLVIQTVAEHGNPHPKGPAALRAVTTKEGGLESVLTEPVGPKPLAESLPANATLAQTVEFWCERRGYAEFADLPPELTLDDVAADPDVFLDLRPEGPALFVRWAYFTGSPAALLAGVDRALANPTMSSVVKSKFEAQKGLILQHWSAAKTLPELDVTPRSPFVPVEVLQDWINSTMLNSGYRAEGYGYEIVVENGMMRVVDNATLQMAIDRSWNIDGIYWLLAYYNRARLVDDLAEDGKQKSAYPGKADAREVSRIDAEYIGKFRDWLADSSWVAAVEATYNTRFAPAIVSFIPTTPVAIAGQSGKFILHPHQNQAVRRVSLGSRARPFLWAADVGAGKTATGTAAAMRWRQQASAQRIVIDVPTSVLAKWYDDGKRVFPDARIGIIGLTPTGPGKAAVDSPDTRLEKWLRFAAGAYDYVIVGHDTFLRDLEPNPDEVGDVMAQVLWAQRGAAKDIAKGRRFRERIEGIRAELARVERATDYSAWVRLVSRVKYPWEEQRKAKISELTTDLREAEAALVNHTANVGSIGTDRDVANVQQLLREQLRTKPYRPSMGKEEEDDGDVGGDAEDGDAAPAKPRKGEDIPLPGLIAWTDVGVDALIVDEAHRFKNLWFPANPIEYAGKGADELYRVKRAWDMFIKTRLIHRAAGGVGGVFFLTATPMTNSPLELYSLLDMVNPRCFEDAGIYDKEQFIDRYWNIEVKDTVRADGSMEPANALVGFKHLDELTGVISGSFDRISTADLILRGWIKALPKAEPEKIMFQRDAAQTMLLRNLTAMYVAWTKDDEEDEGEDVSGGPCGIKSIVDKHLWTLDDRGGLEFLRNPQTRAVVEASVDNCPDILKPMLPDGDKNPFAFVARGIFRLVWMGMLDKIAIAPQLLLKYADKVAVRAVETREAHVEWAAYDSQRRDGVKGAVKPKSKRPKLSVFITNEIATSILGFLSLPALRRFYEARPIVPKIAELARRIASSVDQSSLLVYASPRMVAGMGVEQLSILGDADATTATLVGQSGRIAEAAKFLKAEGVRVDPPKILGRCGHVVFCDPTELHDQIKDAIVAATGGAIPRGRIVVLPKGKAERLAASVGFNGSEATSMSPEIQPIYDVVIGTSKLMAEGIDLQRRSCAVHHLDLPWEPATLHQRNGRAVRQGNIMGRVDVVYYLTAKSFDALRFDKITKKAMWWESMFSGQASTSNPAASDEGAQDLDEIILSMVVEDEAALTTCIAQLRTERQARLAIELRTKAQEDWLIVNSAFAKARDTVDAQRRAVAFQVAARKAEAFRIAFRELVPDGSLEQLAEHAVAVEWSTGRTLVVGQEIRRFGWYNGENDPEFKVVELAVRPKGFVAAYRMRGRLDPEHDLATELLGPKFQPTAPWDWEHERVAVAKALKGARALTSLAYPSPDLRERGTELLTLFLARVADLRGYIEWDVTVSPVFELMDGRIALLTRIQGSRAHETANVQHLLTAPGMFPVKRVVRLGDPEARGLFLSALREDRVWVLSDQTGYGAAATITLGRAPYDAWIALARRIFGSGVAVAEVMRQRILMTKEPKGEAAQAPV